MAYLDHAATTPMRAVAREALVRALGDHEANPSGAHAPARAARAVLDDARHDLAEVLGCDDGALVLTGGGTEGDNLAVLGRHDLVGGTLVCSAVEHHAVLDAVTARDGRAVAVAADGVIDLDGLADVLDERVSLVSVMLVNNEVGVVQPLAEVAALVRRLAPQAVVHTDAVQAVTWLDLRAAAAPADLVTISGHKFGGPRGTGAFVWRDGAALAPRLVGGGQERGRRSGTQDVAGAVAAAAAAVEADRTRTATCARLGRLRDRLVDGLLAAVPDAVETACRPGTGRTDRAHVVPGIAHLCIDGVESEALLYLLEQGGVYASAASSCASGAMEPSHVLAAMGVPRSLAFGSLRLSLGWSSTDADVDHALDVIPPAVTRLRRFARRAG